MEPGDGSSLVGGGGAPALPLAYLAHPLLDPRLPSRNRAVLRFWLVAYRRFRRDPEAYERMLRYYTVPAGDDSASVARPALHRFFRDADSYVDDLLRLLPEKIGERLAPLVETREAHEPLDLLRLALEEDEPRVRYEAQRKLCLANLLYQVDLCRSVRDGARHRAFFDQYLDRHLWLNLTPGSEAQVCCRVVEPTAGGFGGRLEVGVEPGGDARCWRFEVRSLPASEGEPAIDIYRYRSRLKGEVSPEIDDPSESGTFTVVDLPRWPGLGHRSGSIVSKMIRRGIGDPSMVQDVLGAMFIVADRAQAYVLERRLVQAFGGPLRFRDRKDRLRVDAAHVNPRSSTGFSVLKVIVDVLASDPSTRQPYLFPVELQIFPLDAYLRTLHDGDFASHSAYKRRQFLQDLMPVLFPEEVYFEDLAEL